MFGFSCQEKQEINTKRLSCQEIKEEYTRYRSSNALWCCHLLASQIKFDSCSQNASVSSALQWGSPAALGSLAVK